MSKVQTALQGASFEGYVTVSEAELLGMVVIRGDLGHAAFTQAVSEVTECALPEARKMVSNGARSLAWMSSDELMCICAYDEVEALVEVLTERLRDLHALVANVSDARCVIDLTGDAVLEVIAKLAPIDSTQLQQDEIRRTRIAQVAAAFWFLPGGLRIMCFRSSAQYVFDALATVSRKGSEVF